MTQRCIIGLLAAAPLFCQPQFEAASVKVGVPARTDSCRGGPGSADPGRFVCDAWPLRQLIWWAWELTPMALSAPNSTDDARYSITAAVPPHATRHEFNLMLRHLLIDRVGVVVHHETREEPVYELLTAKGGSKLHEAEPLPAGESANDPSAPRVIRDKNGNPMLPPGRSGSMVGSLPGGMLRMSVRMHPVSSIASSLETYVKRRVIDKTGLTGLYDYTVDYAPDPEAGPARPAPEPSKSSEAASPHPDYVQAVTAQLGLRLQSARAKVDVLVVDSFRKVPSEN